MAFFTGTPSSLTESMRIDHDGNLLVGSTSTAYGGIVTARQSGGASSASVACVNAATSGTRRLIDFFTGTSTSRKGSIESNGSTTSFNTSSDYRLKTAVEYDWNATTRLKQLKPARFKWIEDGDNAVSVDGFLAHEVEDIIPEAISGAKDAMRDEEYEVSAAEVDADGNVTKEAVMGTRSVPDYQSIDQAKLVPLLCKTILELEARITALEA